MLFKMLNNILEDWEFIKSIPKGVKPCFNDKTFINVNEWFVTFKRRMKGEIGEKGVIYVNSLIESTSNYYKNITDMNSLRKIKDILIESLLGLENLVYTYKVDLQENVSKDYKNCILKIQKIINEIDKIIHLKSNFFSYSPKLISSNEK